MWWFTALLWVVMLLMVTLLRPRRSSKQMPPGPRGLPIVGSLFELLKENSVEYFTRLSLRYGAVVNVQLGRQRVVVLSSAAWLQQAFVRQGDVFNARPSHTIMAFIGGGRGLLMAEGQKWRDSRRITTHALRGHGVGGNRMENYVKDEVQALMDILKNNLNKPYDVRHDISTTMLNISWHMFAGERFDMGDPTVHWLADSVAKTVSLFDHAGFLNFTPGLQFIGTFLRPLAFQVLYSLVHRIRYFYNLICDHRATLDNPDRERDLVYAFLQEQRNLGKMGKPLGTFTDFQLVWLLSDLFIAGLDTTVSAMRWSLLIIATRRDVAEKLHTEIDTVLDSDRKPCMQDRDSLPYVEAFICEVLRYSSLIPLVPHATAQDTYLGPYRVPKNTMVVANIWAIHHDPKVWGDPEVFRPERFLGSDGEHLKAEHLVPFSLGRRNCVGEALAKTEMFLLLTSMLQEYEFLPDAHMPSLRYVYGLFLHPQPFKLILRARRAHLAAFNNGAKEVFREKFLDGSGS